MRNGWVEVTLGELAAWTSGKNISKDSRSLDGEFPIIGANGEIGRADSFLYDQPLVVVGRVGSCGETHLINQKVWISDNALIAIPNAKIVVTYLYYLLKIFDYNKIISGTTQPLITQGKLKMQAALLPPLPEQKRIVDLISTVDSYIDALWQQLEKAKRARGAVLHELLTAGGDGWLVTSLDEVADVIMGQSPEGRSYNAVGDGLPFMQGSAEFGEHHPIPEKWCSEPRKIAEPGDLLMSVRAPVGDTNFANQQIAVGRGLSIIRANAKSLNGFLRLAVQFNVPNVLASSGTGMFSSITGKNLRSLKISLPPLPEQKRIVDLISTVDSYIEALQVQIDSSMNLRSGLLSDLLSGNHEIPSSYDQVIAAA